MMICAFRQFAENAAGALAIFDGGNRLVYTNRSFRNAFLAGEDAQGERLDGLPLDRDFLLALVGALALAREEGCEQNFEWETSPGSESGDVNGGVGVAAPGGKKQTHQGRVVPYALTEPDGENPRRWIIDIPVPPVSARVEELLRGARQGRKQAEFLRRRSRQLFFDVIDELPIFVYMQRPDYIVAYANKKTRNFYGNTDGRRCYEVFNGLDRPCDYCPTFRVFETGKTEDWQFTDSLGRSFHIYDYPFEDENGDPLVIELGVDVTELKRVERELFQAQKMRAIGVLAGGIAHDLNNNLVPIIFNIDYAMGKLGGPEAEEPLGEALRAAYRAADLVEQVLEYSRQQNLKRSPLHLVEIAQENLALLQASLPEGVTLEVDYTADQDCIEANPSQIQQLLLNLGRNAVQAMPEGGRLAVSVFSSRVRAQTRHMHLRVPVGEYVVLRVADTGQGIEPDRLEQIFEPFYTTKRNSGGTGMGLAVVHAIVTSNGGRILVDSTVGAGTTFTVYLPLVRPVAAADKEQDAPAPVPPTGGTPRLLLVDDDLGALTAMRRVLLEAGFEVVTASSGTRGFEVYKEEEGWFDLVLADQSMPDMPGLELCRRILAINPQARVVICTGHVDPSLEKDVADAGIAGFLTKPMNPARLIESVRRLC